MNTAQQLRNASENIQQAIKDMHRLQGKPSALRRTTCYLTALVLGIAVTYSMHETLGPVALLPALVISYMVADKTTDLFFQ